MDLYNKGLETGIGFLREQIYQSGNVHLVRDESEPNCGTKADAG